MRARRDTLLIVSMVGISALGDFLALIPLMVRLQETGSGLLVSALLLALCGPLVAL